MADVDQHSKLCENSELLGEKVKMIKSALKRPAGINIGLFSFFRPGHVHCVVFKVANRLTSVGSCWLYNGFTAFSLVILSN